MKTKVTRLTPEEMGKAIEGKKTQQEQMQAQLQALMKKVREGGETGDEKEQSAGD